MPKKHANTFKHLQGQASPNTSNVQHGDKKSSSVNERLHELRKLNGHEALQKKRELSDSASQPAVPPQLRSILGLPDAAPPRPRPGVRLRTGVRTPGPAPPQSWLNNRSAPRHVLPLGSRRSRRPNSDPACAARDRGQPREPNRFGRLTGGVPVSETSLLHLSLKATARSLDLFDSDDLPALAELPQYVRSLLLSYVGCYGPPIDGSLFNALTSDGEVWDTLDLGGLAGHGGFALPRLIRSMRVDASSSASPATKSIVLDSWDEAENASPPLQPSIASTRLPSLTHLCLSHPPSNILWQDLLSLANLTPNITHLSLAYWPRPTLTPNLTTARVSGQYGPAVHAGGTHYYSELDQDNAEPTVLLRRLSAKLLRMRWLDLEGCQSWVGALLDISAALELGESQAATNEWQIPNSVAVPVLCGNWRNVTYIRIAQGCLPETMTGQEEPSGNFGSQERIVRITNFMAHGLILGPQRPENLDGRGYDIFDSAKRRDAMWREVEQRLASLSNRANVFRRQHACERIQFDHGWMESH